MSNATKMVALTSLMAFVVFIGLLSQKEEPRTAELRFSEASSNKNIIGSVLPASCESGAWSTGDTGAHNDGQNQASCGGGGCPLTGQTCNGDYIYNHYLTCGYGENAEYCPYGCIHNGGSPNSFGDYCDPTPPPPPPPPNADPIGFHDGVDNNTRKTYGWAFDPDQSGTSIGVHIYIDGPAGVGTNIWAGTANTSRPDVNAAYGIGGNHGFEFIVPEQYCNGYAHNLYAYAINAEGGNNPLLSSSPKQINCYGTPTLTNTYTTAMANPTINWMCPVGAASYSITRSAPWTTAPAWWSGTTLTGNAVDTSVVATGVATTYVYSLYCKNSAGVVLATASTQLTTPLKVAITNLNSPIIPNGTNANLTWNATANSCNVQDTVDGVTWNTIGTVTSSNNSFAYTLNHNVRTELKSSHLSGLGYRVLCVDTTDLRRGNDTDTALVRTYSPIDATITGPYGTGTDKTVNMNCVGDYTHVYINGVLRSPKPNLPLSMDVSDGSNYSIRCDLVIVNSVIDTDMAFYPHNTLSLTGNISPVGGSLSVANVNTVGGDVTNSVTSSSGKYGTLEYSIANANSWIVEVWSTSNPVGAADVTCNGSASCSNNSYRLTGGTSTVTLSNSITYPLGLYVKVTATRGSDTRIMRLVLVNSALAKSDILAVNNAVGSDNYNINLSCKNSDRYELKMDGVTIASGNISPAYSDYTKTVGVLATSPSATSNNMQLICYRGAASDVSNVVIGINSKLSADFSFFSVYPNEQVCGGGDVILTWQVKNAKGKNCRIVATSTLTLSPTATLNYTEKVADISSVNNQLQNTATYKDKTNGSVLSSRLGVFEVTPNNENMTKGEVSGVRVKYSTRFKAICGGINGIPETSKQVDVKVTCRGQE